MDKTVLIDCYPQCAGRDLAGYAAVAIDVIRATTTAVTGVSLGRRCFPVSSIDAALRLASTLPNALLVGELGGNMPYGFDLTNSPAQLAERTDVSRPMVLLSSSGTQLMDRLRQNGAAYVTCFRNFRAVTEHLADNHDRVAVIGAGTRGQFREEDQMCCAWIAEGLIEAGYKAENETTADLVERWSGAAPAAFLESKSVEYLRNSGQLRDLDFILGHFDDLEDVLAICGDEIVMLPAGKQAGVLVEK